MTYNNNPELVKESRYTVTVDEATGLVIASLQLSREEIDNRVQENSQDDDDEEGQEFPIKKVWWCVKCDSSEVRVSKKAYTELDAGLSVCGVQSFSVSRGKCPED